MATVSAERVRDELLRMLSISIALRRARCSCSSGSGLLGVILPELAALRGVPQAKAGPRATRWTTRCAAVDACAARRSTHLRLAALLHDLGKATTARDGHFIGHERVAAELAAQALRRLRVPRARTSASSARSGHHMYDYESAWTDAAVRRFIRRLDGIDRELLFALRRADNAASGVGRAPASANQAELEARIARAAGARAGICWSSSRLAIDGHDLQRELGMAAGPEIGEILDRLTEVVLDDPSRNEREALLALARALTRRHRGPAANRS